MNKESLQKYLTGDYTNSTDFLNNLIFPLFGKENFTDKFEKEEEEHSNLAKSSGICSLKWMGSIYKRNEEIKLYDIEVESDKEMSRNRVEIQRLARKVLGTHKQMLMVFHYTESEHKEWRLSYCQNFEEKEGSDSKRYTYLLGSGN